MVRRQNRLLKPRTDGELSLLTRRSERKSCQEKPLTRTNLPVLKPTQVGKERILRCARKPSLRNSANYIRNFGRRMTTIGEAIYSWSERWWQKRSPSDCLSQTQVPAKAKAEV